MNLSDFDTLAEATAYQSVSYKKITSGQASQFFGITGVLRALNAGTSNTDLVQVLPSLPQTTVGELCDTVVQSSKSTGFTIDPATDEGVINRAGSQILVSAGVLTQPVVDSFFALGEVVTQPFLNATKHDYDKAKGAMVYAQVTPFNGWLKITTTADCEPHRPQIYAEIQGVRRRIAGFDVVEKAGDYLAQVPAQYNTLFVDNAYGVMG